MPYLNDRIPDPALRNEIHDLVNSHQNLKKEPLLFAMFYEPNRNSNNGDLYIFEVLDGFGDNRIDPDGDLFEIEYGSMSTINMTLPRSAKLHLVLTNPIELAAALQQQWPRAVELLKAIERGHSDILFEDKLRGSELRKKLLPAVAAE